MNNTDNLPPKLVMAAAEINDVLKRYDVAATVILHANAPEGPGFMQTTVKLDPSYSCVEWDGKKLHVKEVPGPLVITTIPAQYEDKGKEMVTGTLNMLYNLRMRTGEHYKLLQAAELMLRTKFKLVPPTNGFKKGGKL